MLVREIMTEDVKTVNVGTTVQEAIEMMGEFNIGVLPVCDHGQLAGILTDRDVVVRCFLERKSPTDTRVEDVMTAEAITIRPDYTVEAAAQRLGYHGFRRLPVVEENGRLVGMLAADDIARQSADSVVAMMARRIASQVRAAV